MSVGIGTMGEQEFDECAITRARRRTKRPSPIRVQFRPRWIRAAFEKESSDVAMAELDRSRQRAAAIGPGHADLFRIRVEDRLDAIEISERRSHREIERCAVRDQQPSGSGVAWL